MRKFMQLPFHLRSKIRRKFLGVYVLAIVIVAVSGSLYALQSSTPHMSELAFTETSNDKSVVGEVVPASCVSGTWYEHYWGYNNDGSIDAGCLPICQNGYTRQTTTVYRCSYMTYYREVCTNGECVIETTNVNPTWWQATAPSSCMSVPSDATLTSPSAAHVESKPSYSCVAPTTVNVQFQ